MCLIGVSRVIDLCTDRDKPALLGFSATQAMVIPPISESLKRSRKVPFGLDSSMSWACCLFRKPKIALEKPHTRPTLLLNPHDCANETFQERYPSFQWAFRCFFINSMTPSNHCQKVKFLPGKLSYTTHSRSDQWMISGRIVLMLTFTSSEPSLAHFPTRLNWDQVMVMLR